MHPTLFTVSIGATTITAPTYGLCFVLALTLAGWLMTRELGRTGPVGHQAPALRLWLLLGGLLGARLVYVAIHAGDYVRSCTQATDLATLAWGCTRPLHLWEGGMELWGGLTGGGVALHRYSRQRELAFFHLADALAPAVAMGAFVGRVGCYLAGCCYGRPTTSRLGVPFGPLSLAYHQLVVHRPTATEAAPAATTAALHPTQLYLAGAMLTLFVCLSLLRSVKRAHGEVLLAFVVLYPAATLLPELLRGDRSPQRLLAVSTPALHRWLGLAPEPASVGTLSQLVALLALGGAVALYLRLRADRDR